MRKVIAFLNDESGATAIEYGPIAAGIRSWTLRPSMRSAARLMPSSITSPSSSN